jgi:hypothetical protein
MAIPPSYPPYQMPIVGAGGRVTKPWHLFFLALAGGAVDGGTIDDGSITLSKLQPIPSPRLLGRGSSGNGPVEQITLGTGLAMTGTVLSVTAGGAGGIDQLGYWTPITDGVTPIAELLFDDDGDCVVGFVPTP